MSLLVRFSYCFSQVNLVPNPSFEQYDTCPFNDEQIRFASPWFQPTTGSSDYFNSCSTPPTAVDVPLNMIGSQNAKTGVAYAGVFTYYDTTLYREYIEVQLINPLTSSVKYFVTFNVSLGDNMHFASNNIGIHFSTDSVLNSNYLNLTYTPQVVHSNVITDTAGWTLITGEYIATGGEKFITIGNFSNDAGTTYTPAPSSSPPNVDFLAAYYYIDDVCVSNDSTICYLGTGIFEPSASSIWIYPNPVKDYLHIKANEKILRMKIFSAIQSINIELPDINSDSYYYSFSELPQGIYFFQIETMNGSYTKKIVRIN